MTHDHPEEELVPTSGKEIFLLVRPPKSILHDQHKYIQIQRIVHQGDEYSGLRIRPIFNLEYHRFLATRIIELEHDDARVAEFHPLKALSDERHEVPAGDVGRSRSKRRRARSIDHKTGANGGKIKSEGNKVGICDMVVIGSEKQGIFLFQCADGQAITWKKEQGRLGSVEWRLDTESGGPQHAQIESLPALVLAAKVRQSYEFTEVRPAPIVRTQTSATMDSQYTTQFVNESQLSGLTNSPQLDPRDGISTRTSHDDGNKDTILASHPKPHLRVHVDHGRRTSMHQIAGDNDRLHRLLVCALWITWSSPDILEDPEALRVEEHQDGLVDRHSKIALSRGTEFSDVGTTRDLKAEEAPRKKKGGGIFAAIGRICGGR